MNNITTILGQILQVIPRNRFQTFVNAGGADRYVKTFSTWIQLVTLVTAQIKGWRSLREVQTGFMSNSKKLYHLGFKSIPKRSNLSYANTNRSHKIFESLFYELLKRFQGKLIGKKLKFRAPLYLFDSTYIDLCIGIFDWAKFRYNKGAIKLHTSFEVQEQIPNFVNITDGKVHDLDGIRQDYSVYSDSIVCFDRAYSDIDFFAGLDDVGATFVTRLKKRIRYKIVGQHSIHFRGGVLKDEIIELSTEKSYEKYPQKLRLVTYYDKEKGKTYKFVTNNFKYGANTIANIYKLRWEIELFFKWIKQNLKIKTSLGTSQNAVKIQIWVAMITYLMLAYMKSQSSYPYSILEFTRITRELLFDYMSLVDIFSANFESISKIRDPDPSQLAMI